MRLPELDEPTLRYRLGLPPAAEVEAESKREEKRRRLRRRPFVATAHVDGVYHRTDSPGPGTGESE